eukprot:scaffold130810_cov32-Tisochrysis_lutea.AAC.2
MPCTRRFEASMSSSGLTLGVSDAEDATNGLMSISRIGATSPVLVSTTRSARIRSTSACLSRLILLAKGCEGGIEEAGGE